MEAWKPQRSVFTAWAEARQFCRSITNKTRYRAHICKQYDDIMITLHDKQGDHLAWECYEPIRRNELIAIDNAVAKLGDWLDYGKPS